MPVSYPFQLGKTIEYSGMFWENLLCNNREEKRKNLLQLDFKGQCLRLFGILKEITGNSSPIIQTMDEVQTLPIPGALPQPIKQSSSSLVIENLDKILATLQKQVGHTLARMETHQLLHLVHRNEESYSLWLEFPLNTLSGLEIIPLLIQEHRHSRKLTASWSIDFAIHLNNLGDIQAKVSLKNTEIHIQINAALVETVELLEGYQTNFAQLIQALGLNLKIWNLQLGLKENEAPSSQLRLLDIRI